MRAEYKVRNAPEKPVLIYDGECRFCRFWMRRWDWMTGGRVEYAPSQAIKTKERFPEIPREAYDDSVQYVEPDGSVYHGSEAALRSLGTNPKLRWLQWMYYKVPGFAPATEWAYRKVSEHRSFLSKINRGLFGRRAGKHVAG